MSILDIVLYPDERLKRRCKPVAEVNEEVRKLVDDMFQTMYDAPGVGLAAPQVGSDLRVIVLDCSPPDGTPQPHALINPEIFHKEGKLVWEEGCLSIPSVYEKVERAAKVKVRYLDRAGEPQEMEADELLAVCIQHEVDHLDGVLFLDHLSRLKRRLAERAFKKNLPNYFKDLEEKKKKRAEGEKPKPEGAQPSAQEPG